MSLTHEDVTPGLVIQLDTATLRALGGAQTNAVLGPEGDRSVVGTQDFLIVGVDAAAGRCTGVPLFAKTAVGNQPLENDEVGTRRAVDRHRYVLLALAALAHAGRLRRCRVGR